MQTRKIALACVLLGALSTTGALGQQSDVVQVGAAKRYTVKIPIEVFSGGRVVRSYDSIPVMSAKGEMQIKAGDIANDFPGVPSQSLSAALKQDKSSKKFRVSWTSFSMDYSIRVTALYNRDSNTIKYFRYDSSGRDEDYHQYHYAALVRGVTDTMLHQVGDYKRNNAKNPTGAGSIDVETGGFTDFLTRYGARIAWSNRRELKQRTTTLQEGQSPPLSATQNRRGD